MRFDYRVVSPPFPRQRVYVRISRLMLGLSLPRRYFILWWR